MAEIDYQLALLLQHKFEQEAKKPKEHKSDIEFAKILQEQFVKENEIETPKNGLVYATTTTDLNSSKCLVDPSWEVIDPTPDIHILFMSFNDRYFWGTLAAVCVSWSKRMTTCAGICSYQGRGGLCSITLSEPLLKLRPRKDLVETLLHEMIHAYLFITNNNRDRDGHGPEFHKHMYRINKESGTNITVYHDFHDEVRLYKQHWWRCDGPCHKRKPYFGMVQRATNRAPGPNDRWWAEHSRNCGGTFIKVREPEKPAKTPAKENVKPKEDIRKYISPTKKGTGTTTPTTSTPKSSTSTTNKNHIHTINNISDSNKRTSTGNSKSSTKKTISNIHTINNSADNSKKINAVIPKANIFGFINTTGSSKAKGGGTAIKNNTNTIVINKKPTTSKTSNVSSATTQSSNVSSSSAPTQDSSVSSSVTTQLGNVLKNSSENSDNIDYDAVRNYWLNKYSTTVTNGVKRPAAVQTVVAPEKIPRLKKSNSIDNVLNNTKMTSDSPMTDTVSSENESMADCPVCLEPVVLSKFNHHLDQCLEKPKMKECIICGQDVTIAEYEIHVTKCSEENFDSPKEREQEEIERKPCTICEKVLTEAEFDAHIEKCLHKFYDGMEEEYCDKGDCVDCLTCGKNIPRSELNSHLDDCTGLSRVFEDDSLHDEVEEDVCDSDKEKKFNCPFCMVLVPEEEMSGHIDSCLGMDSGSSQTELNKAILVKSLMDDEF